MSKAGETADLSVSLADVFAGEVDFNSELQPGDRFRLVVDKSIRDHRVVGYGPLAAATLQNAGRTLVAIRFKPAGGKEGYYDGDGKSLKRFFLRSPLKFDPSISSGFSRSRQHPILNIRRAHLGVDYRAPSGAPVVAVSAGTVTMAAWTTRRRPDGEDQARQRLRDGVPPPVVVWSSAFARASTSVRAS